jgi:hypothetical protein
MQAFPNSKLKTDNWKPTNEGQPRIAARHHSCPSRLSQEEILPAVPLEVDG